MKVSDTYKEHFRSRLKDRTMGVHSLKYYKRMIQKRVGIPIYRNSCSRTHYLIWDAGYKIIVWSKSTKTPVTILYYNIPYILNNVELRDDSLEELKLNCINFKDKYYRKEKKMDELENFVGLNSYGEKYVHNFLEEIPLQPLNKPGNEAIKMFRPTKEDSNILRVFEIKQEIPYAQNIYTYLEVHTTRSIFDLYQWMIDPTLMEEQKTHDKETGRVCM